MKRIWVVRGFCGEYSDRQEWTVCAYADMAEAEAHVGRATAWVQENADRIRNYNYRGEAPQSPHDGSRAFSGYYASDTTYGIEECVLWEQMDTSKVPQ